MRTITSQADIPAAMKRSSFSRADEAHMRRALALAARGTGNASPNPLVGAVIVRDGRVIGEGWHRRYGEKHAEAEAVDAASAAGESVAGTDMYCTLEPCCFTGPGKHQPPCTDLIVSSGIRRLFLANRDPHPAVNGEGIRVLRQAGVEVFTGLLEERGEELNEGFFTYQRLCRPFVHLKIAQSLDGRIAAGSGDAKWITDETARRRVHRMRARYDAVLIGSGTAAADDPELTVRLARGRNPARVVLDSRLSLPETSKLLSLPDRDKTLVVCGAGADPARVRKFEEAGVTVLALAPQAAAGGGLPLGAVLEALAGRGIRSVLVEGGSKIFTAFLREGLWDRISIFIAPILMGGGVDAVGNLGVEKVRDALRLGKVRVRRLGDQLLVEGRNVHGNR